MKGRTTLLCTAASLLGALAVRSPAQVTSRVSVSSAGAQADGDAFLPSISADGRCVAFESGASNLVDDDTNSKFDVFVRDRRLGRIERLSVSSAGAQGNGDSDTPAISADGRYVAFASLATNLVAGDSNLAYDVFLRDRLLGVTERVSVDSAGTQGDGASGHDFGISISADGRYVAFASDATNLVVGDANGTWDVFVRDRLLGTTERVSVDSGGAEGDGLSYGPSISADGRFVAFASLATNLVAGDTNGSRDVFVRDRLLATTERVSVDSTGAESQNDTSGSIHAPLSISADGLRVAFSSDATNLVPGDTNGTSDVFVRDRLFGTTERVSVDSAGTQGNADSFHPSISADGLAVAFDSFATNLVSGDTNAVGDVFVRNLRRATTERVSVSSAGAQASRWSDVPSISTDGRCVAFDSADTSLASGDTNAAWDAFVRDRFGSAGFTSSCDPLVGGVVGCPCANPPSGPGRGCDNSAATGGARLSAEGGPILSSDSLSFTTNGEPPGAATLLVQGTATIASGAPYGQGVRCVGGALVRLYAKTATGGGVTAPDLAAGDPTVSARSAAKGDEIGAGESRWYLAYYRDTTVLGGCPATSTFNATQTGRIVWSP